MILPLSMEISPCADHHCRLSLNYRIKTGFI
jgi:hypothetical protein